MSGAAILNADDLVAALARAVAREMRRRGMDVGALGRTGLPMARTAEEIFEIAKANGVQVGFIVMEARRRAPAPAPH